MAKAEVSTMLKRPVEDVWTVISNVEDNANWSSFALEAKQTSPGPIGVRTTARFMGKFLGRRMESEQVITEFEPNRKSSWESKSGLFPIGGRPTATRRALNGDAERHGYSSPTRVQVAAISTIPMSTRRRPVSRRRSVRALRQAPRDQADLGP